MVAGARHGGRRHLLVGTLLLALFVSAHCLDAHHGGRNLKRRRKKHEIHSPVKTVVVVVMENRSFDHILGWLRAGRPNIDGLTGLPPFPSCLFLPRPSSMPPWPPSLCPTRRIGSAGGDASLCPTRRIGSAGGDAAAARRRPGLDGAGAYLVGHGGNEGAHLVALSLQPCYSDGTSPWFGAPA